MRIIIRDKWIGLQWIDKLRNVAQDMTSYDQIMAQAIANIFPDSNGCATEDTWRKLEYLYNKYCKNGES